MKIFSVAGLRARVEMMSLRTRGVAVAVRQMMGVLGYAIRKWERWEYAVRKSWPHSDMQ